MTTEILETKTFTPVANTIRAVRRTRRAYFGLHVAAFEQAQIGFAKARTLTDEFFNELVVKGEAIEVKAGDVFKGTQVKVIASYNDAGDTLRDILPLSTSRVEELEAEVAELTAKLGTLAKSAAKKPATKKKTAAKAKIVLAEKYLPYLQGVLAYDKKADGAIVKKIVDHLGIALQSRDGQFVACSDETERHTVRDSWLIKKLGLKANAAALDTKVMAVCEIMQKDRMKSRVTFYYLLAKTEGKLTSL